MRDEEKQEAFLFIPHPSSLIPSYWTRARALCHNRRAIQAQLNLRERDVMAENETAAAAGADAGDEATAPTSAPTQAQTEEITYHAVEKDGQVTAILEMQGRKHLRTIDPRSRQGQEILRLYTAEHEQQ